MLIGTYYTTNSKRSIIYAQNNVFMWSVTRTVCAEDANAKNIRTNSRHFKVI